MTFLTKEKDFIKTLQGIFHSFDRNHLNHSFFHNFLMAFDKYFLQKTMFACLITLINVTAISIAYVFSAYWYYVQIPLLLVLFFNMSTVFMSLICSIVKSNKKVPEQIIPPTTVGYFIPCYNESKCEITNTLQSFFGQVGMQKHRELYFTVCDGRKTGSGNLLSTDKILKQQIFTEGESINVVSAYSNAEGQSVDVECLIGTCRNGKPYFVIIKEKNCGKRDSIAISRRLFYGFNTQKCPAGISPDLLNLFSGFVRSYSIFRIQFIVGVDADTEFEPNCTVQLLRQICRKPNILASSGMVKVTFPKNDSFANRIWQGYQHVEYLAGQGFLRNQQNLTQQKINCLPGCLNIIRICEETCGERLLGEYMLPPKMDQHIFQQIRGTASEDRHSVMLLLKTYGQCHTTVNWHAQARTAVPTNLSVFLSQRRRWSLGSATHGGWLIFMPNIPMWERFSSFIFVLTYLINPFLMYSAAVWIYVLINGHGDTTYFIFTGVVQIVTFYKLLIPIWCPLSCWERVAFYLFYLTYVLFGPFIGIMVLCYSMYNMDDFGWGKTRQVVEQKDITIPPFTNITNINNTTYNIETAKPFPASQLLYSPHVKLQNPLSISPTGTFRDSTNISHNNSSYGLYPSLPLKNRLSVNTEA